MKMMKTDGQKLHRMQNIPKTMPAVRNSKQQKHFSTVGVFSEICFMVFIFKLLSINMKQWNKFKLIKK